MEWAKITTAWLKPNAKTLWRNCPPRPNVSHEVREPSKLTLLSTSTHWKIYLTWVSRFSRPKSKFHKMKVRSRISSTSMATIPQSGAPTLRQVRPLQRWTNPSPHSSHQQGQVHTVVLNYLYRRWRSQQPDWILTLCLCHSNTLPPTPKST